jgi:hypothetical protein
MISLTHTQYDLGTLIGNIQSSHESPEALWQAIVALAEEHTNSVDGWCAYLEAARDAGLDGELAVNNSDPVNVIIDDGDGDEARTVSQALLNDHNFVGWWLKHNLDGDTLCLHEQGVVTLDPMTLIEPDVNPESDHAAQAYFYTPAAESSDYTDDE